MGIQTNRGDLAKSGRHAVWDRRMRSRAGFTAEELIVCLGMILLGMCGVWLTTAKAPPRARASSCASNVAQLARATLMYANDYDGRTPHSEWAAEMGGGRPRNLRAKREASTTTGGIR